MDVSVLEKIGLTRNEIKVYITFLKSGPSSISKVISQTGMHRSSVYDAIERLIEKGLMGYLTGKQKKIYEAVNPKRLLEMLKEKEAELESAMPMLLNLASQEAELNVKIYQGFNSVKTGFDELNRQDDKNPVGMGCGAESYSHMPSFIDGYHKKRIKKNIRMRYLYRNSAYAKSRGKETAKLPLTEVRYLPKQIKTPSAIHISGELILFLSLPKEEKIPSGMLVINKDLAKSLKEYFEVLWSISS